LTFNPNYKAFVLTQITFECPNSGLVIPFSSSRALRHSHYAEKRDIFRACLEVIFLLFILAQDVLRVRAYLRIWKKDYQEVSSCSS
jgi:hypothetical protein